MALVSQILKSKPRTFSFEVFPAQTPEGQAKLLKTVDELCALKPDFISCTYGAGGSSRDRTFDVVEYIQTTHSVPSMAHLTCVSHTRTEIQAILEEFKRRGITNILALRGDPPKDKDTVTPVSTDFKYSSDLVAFIRTFFKDKVSIGVAGFPETHLLAPNAEADAQYLKQKISAGADFVITQLFFDSSHYFDYVNRLRKLGVTNPVVPGILPITDYAALKRFCERCGANVPDEVHKLFSPIAEDSVTTIQSGIGFAIKQCRQLLEGGAPGIHFYTLNKTFSVERILKSLR